jgi:hypothetical protein
MIYERGNRPKANFLRKFGAIMGVGAAKIGSTVRVGIGMWKKYSCEIIRI